MICEQGFKKNMTSYDLMMCTMDRVFTYDTIENPLRTTTDRGIQ